MSVDDVIAAVIGVCEELKIADSTYFFYSSDHGFQLGQFNIPMDKRHVYEWDTKIHLLGRGPGIAPGSYLTQPATQVDMAPTWLGLAGLAKPAQMDGKSLVPLFIHKAHMEDTSPGAVAASSDIGPPILPSTRLHLKQLGDADKYAAAWRTSVFIEYQKKPSNSSSGVFELNIT